MLFCSCSPPSPGDAGSDGGLDASLIDASIDSGEPRDPGFDIPPSEWIDGGEGEAWGCYGRNKDRFIARFETKDGNLLWCASILFKRQDGGFQPLFPDFVGPENFQIADARWAITCDGLELTNGELNHDRTRPVHDLSGEISLTAFYMERPQIFVVDAGIRVAYRVYRVLQWASLSETCAGP
ncbi:MAG: hypothetical protein ACOZQL_07595 [Myxococcota bacterium]